MKYTIKKGGHYAFPFFVTPHFGRRRRKIKVELSEGWSQVLPDLPEGLDDDWSKLYGWSYGYHMNHSIRIGLRPSRRRQGCVDFCLFAHIDGAFLSSMNFLTIDMKEGPLGFDLQYNSQEDAFFLFPSSGEAELVIDFPNEAVRKWGYSLKPYYGGDRPAPVKLFAEIKIIR